MGPATDRIVCAVMAGGSGTRFWPLSRRGEPKQLLRFLGDSTLLGATVDRLKPLCPPQRWLVITAAHLVQAVQQMLPDLPDGHIIGEPVARNTAPCMAIAAMAAQSLVADAILVLLPADHWVANPVAFAQAIAIAAVAADAGQIVTLGVVPTQPETGYGYIEVQGPAVAGVAPVARFVEKPSLDTALQYLADGRHLWNAGVFVVRADRALRALDDHVAEIGTCLEPLRHQTLGSSAWQAILNTTFPQCPSVSIDYAVMEHESAIGVVRLEAGWSDVGTWHSILALRRQDEQNFSYGPVLAIDCDQCVLISKGPYVAAIGLHNMAVVATDDATLVVPLDRSQDVRQVVAQVTAAGRGDLL